MIAILPVKDPEKLGRMRADAEAMIGLWATRESGASEHLQPPPGEAPQVLSSRGQSAGSHEDASPADLPLAANDRQPWAEFGIRLLAEPLLAGYEMTGAEEGGWVLCLPRIAPGESPVLWMLAAEAPDAATLDALARTAIAAALRRGVEQAAAHPATALCQWMEKTAAAQGLACAAGAPLPAEALLRCAH